MKLSITHWDANDNFSERYFREVRSRLDNPHEWVVFVDGAHLQFNDYEMAEIANAYLARTDRPILKNEGRCDCTPGCEWPAKAPEKSVSARDAMPRYFVQDDAAFALERPYNGRVVAKAIPYEQVYGTPRDFLRREDEAGYLRDRLRRLAAAEDPDWQDDTAE